MADGSNTVGGVARAAHTTPYQGMEGSTSSRSSLSGSTVVNPAPRPHSSTDMDSIFARDEWTNIGLERLELGLGRQYPGGYSISSPVETPPLRGLRRDTPVNTTERRMSPLDKRKEEHQYEGKEKGEDSLGAGLDVDLDLDVEVQIEGEATPARRVSKADLGDGEGVQNVVIISWGEDDPENPFNWPTRRKYMIIITASIINMLSNANMTSPSILVEYGAPWFGVSSEQYIASLTVPLLSYSFTPMILTPLSEIYGRYWIFQINSVITALLFIPQAISRSYAGLLVARWFQGMSSSVGNALVSGAIADVVRPTDRGLAMGIFALLTFIGQALGGMLGGVIVERCGIQWCYGLQGIAGGVSCLLNVLFLRETRADILLTRKARLMTRKTGVPHVVVADLEKKDLKTIMTVSLIRPFQYLFTEPIVSALSAWIAFAWACIFLGGTSVYLVFEQYGFGVTELGLFQTPVLLGGLLGFAANYHETYSYRRHAAQRGGVVPPETRLRWAAYGGVMFPLAMFVFAWTGRPPVPWIVPAIALVVAYWGVYCMYTGVFNYLADAYETYSSSAQAAQSWARNIFSALFPLFGRQLYHSMGYPQASTLVASIALGLSVAPLLLIRYGKDLRERSTELRALP